MEEDEDKGEMRTSRVARSETGRVSPKFVDPGFAAWLLACDTISESRKARFSSLLAAKLLYSAVFLSLRMLSFQAGDSARARKIIRSSSMVGTKIIILQLTRIISFFPVAAVLHVKRLP